VRSLSTGSSDCGTLSQATPMPVLDGLTHGYIRDYAADAIRFRSSQPWNLNDSRQAEGHRTHLRLVSACRVGLLGRLVDRSGLLPMATV
jgi:hypothetical protein